MQGIRPQGLTNHELARTLYAAGVKNVPPEVLEHVALRFIELFRDGRETKAKDITYVPTVV